MPAFFIWRGIVILKYKYHIIIIILKYDQTKKDKNF